MATTIAPLHDPPSCADPDRIAIQLLHQLCHTFGLGLSDAVSIWIALKSKPGLILWGPSGSNKLAFAAALAKLVSTEADPHDHRFVGHSWWATGGAQSLQLAHAQEMFSSFRFRSLLSEAHAHADAGLLYFAILAKISPAELQAFFIRLFRQVKQYGRLLEIPPANARDPIPFPDNLYMIATIDLQEPTLVRDPQLLDHAFPLKVHPRTPGLGGAPLRSSPESSSQFQAALFARRVFDRAKARTVVQATAFGPKLLGGLAELALLIRRHDLPFQRGLIDDALLFLANAWDSQGLGLFSLDPDQNFDRAVRFWLERSAIPRLSAVLGRSVEVGREFQSWLDGYWSVLLSPIDLPDQA